jgi:hypothetical protein
MRYLKHPKPLLLALLILPWFSLPLLGKQSINRFSPASIFISLFVRLERIVAEKRRWWWVYEKLSPKLVGEFPLIWGPFLVGSMWILKLTYGRFYLYMISNLIVDTLFTYPFVNICKKLGILSLVRLKKYQLSLLFFFKSLLLYGFQYTKENLGKNLHIR